MATDNLMAGITGGLTGVSDILGKYFDSELKGRQRSRDLLEEQDIWEQRLPMEEASKIRVEQARPRTNYYRDEQGNLVPVEGRVFNAPKTPTSRETPEEYAAKIAAGEEAKAKVALKFPKPSMANEKTYETLVSEAAKSLPKLKTKATTSKTSVGTINKALGLIDKGGVTGKGGQWKAFFAPYVELVGEVPENMTDAQAFQSLTRLIVGPLRLEIVGSGPVSDYEQKLIKELSGGGGTAKAASKELLNYYKNIAKNQIKDYNSTLEGAVTLDKRFNDLYKSINEEDEVQEIQGGGFTPDKKSRLEELRKKRESGTLGQ